MRKMLFAGCLLVLFCLQAEAQTMEVVADKIVGQVGDKIILKSDPDSPLYPDPILPYI